MKTCPTCKSNHSDHYSHCPLDGTPLVDSSLWTEGGVVRGKYRILGKIGQGGMGAVYKAQHVRFKEVCAIKVMAPELMKDPVFLKRFEHEAVLTRKLQHPNAVRVEYYDEAEDGRPFIVMEYIEGCSLKDVIAREAPMPVARVCSIAKQVASALDAAHKLGMVHRDIKPDNIVLLGGTGVPPVDDHGQDGHATPDHPIAKVLDFGIAKMKEGLLETTGIGMTLTGTGVAIGTPSYMSPEQALGKKGDELDGRSDIYSLGVVMYQMLSGELPLQADTPIQMLMAHIQTPPRPLRETRHGAQLPGSISDLVMQCLSKSPNQRPAAGHAMIEAIEYWQGEPSHLAPAQAKQKGQGLEQIQPERGAPKRPEEKRLAEQARAEGEAGAAWKAEAEQMARDKARAESEWRMLEEAKARLRADQNTEAQIEPATERPPVWTGRVFRRSLIVTIAATLLVALSIWFYSMERSARVVRPFITALWDPDPATQSQAAPSHEAAVPAASGGTAASESAAVVGERLKREALSNPSSAAAALTLANYLYDQKLFNQAVPWYEKALALDPKNGDAATDLGTCFVNLGRLDDGVREYRQSLRLDPRHEGALFNLAVVYIEDLNDPRAASEAWESLRRLNPNYPNLGRLKKAIDDARSSASGAAPPL